MFNKMGTSMRAVALLAPLALSMAACTGDTGEGTARSAPFNAGRQLAISDQLHNNGTAGFVFLPPMVPRPAIFGDFLPDLEPIVRIDEVRADGTTVRTLATFTRDSGPSRERIRVHHQGRPCDADDDDGDDDPNGYFYARWRTNHERLSPSAIYRVRVFVQERVHPCTRNGYGRRCRHGEDNLSPMREVGFADVDVVRNHHEVRCVDRAEFVPLVNGHVLRIKFRIDRPVVDADGDGVYNWRDNCRTTANASQLDTNNDGEGDACECAGVTCAASDACHVAGTCNPTNGLCPNPAAPDGSACPLANAAGACTAGACGVATCNAGFANCDASAGNGCEQPTNTLTHCGGCNVACTSGPHSSPTCATGTCALTCAAGWADCDGDRANGCEQNVATDENHCGACGNVCTDGRTCIAGGCSAMACTAGRANCDDAEANGCEVTLASNVSHCGACGNACATANGTPACVASACAVGACTAPYYDRDGQVGNGCESNSLTDVLHCGAANVACDLPNAAAVCAAGACAIGSCIEGFADVDNNPANGCEVNLATDPSHCGAQGNACSAANGTAGCAGGLCTVVGCNPGFDNCDGNAANGCERDLRSDVGHCGTCGNACPSGANSEASCAAGACVLTCAEGFANCDGDAANGCEIDSTSDRANCGGCGVACAASETCQSGVCSALVCTAPQANCDDLGANGCEVNTSNTVAHCGSCNHACATPNATSDCIGGLCGYSVCNEGFGDVNGDRADGCEVNFNTDLQHCGGQNRPCLVANGTAVCANGTCGVAGCNAGFSSNGTACVDVDECAANTDNCAANATCTNTPGSFTCLCNAGFSGDGVTCADLDECAAIPAPVAATCSWNVGAQNAVNELAGVVANPSGAWTYFYGPSALGAGTLSEYVTAAQVVYSAADHTDAWYGSPFLQGYVHDFGANVPMVVTNTSPAPGGITTPYGAPVRFGELLYHPGPPRSGGRYNTIRWTAPAAGTFRVTAAWRISHGAAVDFAVLQNRALPALATGRSPGSYNATLTLAAGATLDFALGFGADFGSTTTGIGIQVQRLDGGCPANCVDANVNGVCDEFDIVRPSACGAGFTCVNLPGSFRCDNINDCAPNPCQNSGTCTDGVNSYTCACQPGYSGTNCQVNINDCAPNPCQNSGTCTDGVASYTCTCTGGYTGTNCEIAPVLCPSASSAPAGSGLDIYGGAVSLNAQFTRVAVDPRNGDFYTLGYGSSPGSGVDTVVRKFARAGTEIVTAGWPKTLNYNNTNDVPVAIVVDGNGNVFVQRTGMAPNPARDGEWDPHTWSVLKFSAGGVQQWEVVGVTDRSARGDGIAVDEAGDVYASSDDQGAPIWRTQLTKLSGASGAVIWQQQRVNAGDGQYVAGRTVFARNGAVYWDILGTPDGTPGGPDTVTVAAAGGASAHWWHLKFDAATGVQLWSQIVDSINSTYNYHAAFAVDSTGSLYSAGSLGSNPSFVKLKKLDAAGTLLGTLDNGYRTWAFVNPTPQPCWSAGGTGLHVDAGDNVYMSSAVCNTSSYQAHDGHLVRYNSTGAVQWQFRTSGAAGEFYHMAADTQCGQLIVLQRDGIGSNAGRTIIRRFAQ